MDVGSALPADQQPAVAVQPSKRPRRLPAMPAQLLAGLAGLPCNASPPPTGSSIRRGIIALPSHLDLVAKNTFKLMNQLSVRTRKNSLV